MTFVDVQRGTGAAQPRESYRPLLPASHRPGQLGVFQGGAGLAAQGWPVGAQLSEPIDDHEPRGDSFWVRRPAAAPQALTVRAGPRGGAHGAGRGAAVSSRQLLPAAQDEQRTRRRAHATGHPARCAAPRSRLARAVNAERGGPLAELRGAVVDYADLSLSSVFAPVDVSLGLRRVSAALFCANADGMQAGHAQSAPRGCVSRIAGACARSAAAPVRSLSGGQLREVQPRQDARGRQMSLTGSRGAAQSGTRAWRTQLPCWLCASASGRSPSVCALVRLRVRWVARPGLARGPDSVRRPWHVAGAQAHRRHAVAHV